MLCDAVTTGNDALEAFRVFWRRGPLVFEVSLVGLKGAVSRAEPLALTRTQDARSIKSR